jgi:hypothetical protein
VRQYDPALIRAKVDALRSVGATQAIIIAECQRAREVAA